jgi:hypothetical protein
MLERHDTCKQPATGKDIIQRKSKEASKLYSKIHVIYKIKLGGSKMNIARDRRSNMVAHKR